MTFVLQDFQAGLSWREELDLKKALQMSMQDQKRLPEGCPTSTQGGATGTFRAPSGAQSSQSQGSLLQAAHQRSKSAGDL